ncbi:MAG: T9SS type A sorting domain-containing protein, partial [Bacteroidetes bacterium]|nr:T9SS type A sorting domain-containing protein [Bacteroidota bacterium]
LFIIFFHPHLLKCQSIATHLQESSFCAGYEIRFTFSVPPVTFGSGNLFIAQLSDEAGNFTSPVNIDTLQRVDPDTIVGLIPFNTPAGYGYRVRVISTDPPITGTDNGCDLKLCSSSPIAQIELHSDKTTICQGDQVVFTASSVNPGSNAKYTFFKNGDTLQSSTSTVFSTSDIADGDVFTCILSQAVPYYQGYLDTTFHTGAGFDQLVASIKIQNDGKIIAIGNFLSYNGDSCTRMARLNTDGSLDPGFNSGSGFNGTNMYDVEIMPDGSYLVSGDFTIYNGRVCNRLARIFPDGSLDTLFMHGTGLNWWPWPILVQPDGRILAGGAFTSYDGESYNRIIRLLPDGSPDTSFHVANGFAEPWVRTMDLQSDGKILVGGSFDIYNGTYSPSLIRLNKDGSIDTTFHTGTGFNGSVTSVKVAPDGKILATGGFTIYNYQSHPGSVRLFPNGSCDPDYHEGSGFNNVTWDVFLQPDGKIMNVGSFTGFDGYTAYSIVRQLYDGPRDFNFYTGSGFSFSCYSVDMQKDGKIVVGGQFSQFNGTAIKNIARLKNNVCYSENVKSNPITIHVKDVFNDQQICLVTVDTVTWKNKILWEKTDGYGSASFNIYKEVATNIYNWLGSVSYDSASYFIDYSGNPELHGDKYKISVVDSCGNESEMSYFHRTMNLTISAFGSTMGLNWENYEEESGSFVPSNYFIFKGASPESMTLLDSLSGSFSSYNDNNVFGTYYYMIGVQKTPPCAVSDKGMLGISFSNKKRNVSEGIDESEFSGLISIIPNPFDENTIVKFPNPTGEKYKLVLSDLAGRKVREEFVSGSTVLIERKDLKSGFYNLQISGSSVFNRKVIIK